MKKGYEIINKEFFYFCYNYLKVYARNIRFRKPKTTHHINAAVVNSSGSYRLVTHNHPMFIDIYNDFYKNKKKRLTENIFTKEIFTPLMLAVWFMGDGSSNKRGYIRLATHSFTYKEHYLMRKAFIERFKLSPTIRQLDKNYYLQFHTVDSQKIIEIVKPYIVHSMKYKVLPILKKDWLKQNTICE